MKFSEMYVKFVFSNIVKDIYEEINPGDVKALSKMDRQAVPLQEN